MTQPYYDAFCPPRQPGEKFEDYRARLQAYNQKAREALKASPDQLPLRLDRRTTRERTHDSVWGELTRGGAL